MSKPMALLLAAIAFEVVATTALKACESFSKPLPTLIVILGYVASLFLFSQALTRMNVGIAYAIWAGLGIVLVTVSSAVVYHQSLDRWGVAGIALILCGVAVLNLLSRTTIVADPSGDSHQLSGDATNVPPGSVATASLCGQADSANVSR